MYDIKIIISEKTNAKWASTKSQAFLSPDVILKSVYSP